MFFIAKWCQTHRNIIYGNQKDKMNQHIHTECIFEPFKFEDMENHPKCLRNKGKQHISIHRYRKFLLCLKHLPTEQIEIWLLEPHSNKEHPSQNQHKTANKKQSCVPKAAWNQEEAEDFYLERWKRKSSGVVVREEHVSQALSCGSTELPSESSPAPHKQPQLLTAALHSSTCFWL